MKQQEERKGKTYRPGSKRAERKSKKTEEVGKEGSGKKRE